MAFGSNCSDITKKLFINNESKRLPHCITDNIDINMRLPIVKALFNCRSLIGGVGKNLVITLLPKLLFRN